ncbi:MAG: hypothetical protein K0B05_00315 [Bacteroidales bacterium]|nr:hypothetical protein [Bacteroidales bacterium]
MIPYGDTSDRVRLFRKSISMMLVFIASLSVLCAQATKKDVPPLKERLFYGGSIGLQFGTITDIQISPVVGLWLLPRLGVAAGPNFRFYKNPYEKTTIYGGRSYLQFLFIQDLNSVVPLGIHIGMFLHTEYEVLSLESEFWKLPPYQSDRFTTGTLLAGGGISQPIGRRSALNFMVLWALNDSGYGLYSNPEIRISVVF